MERTQAVNISAARKVVAGGRREGTMAGRYKKGKAHSLAGESSKISARKVRPQSGPGAAEKGERRQPRAYLVRM